MRHHKSLPAIAMPVLFFGLAACVGAILLHHPVSLADRGSHLSWTDAFFTAISAVCVTGLGVVSTGSFFSRFGQGVILVLIQIGGLGIMTFTSLTFFLLRRRVSLTDRIAVGQAILHDRSFDLGQTIKAMVVWTLLIEAVGALLIYGLGRGTFSPSSAVFHAVSAFCNAGFSLRDNSLMGLQGAWGLNAVFMLLIILGGLGFSILVELQPMVAAIVRGKALPGRLSWYSTVVIRSSLLLIILGGGAIFLAEYIGFNRQATIAESLLASFFQAVTCRTAGFNSLNIAGMTNVSLLIMMILMFIGGAPGSCAGGVKVTTFRVLAAFVMAQVRGRSQVVIGRFGVSRGAVAKALVLLVFAVTIIFAATLVLMVTEGGDVPHPQARGLFLEVLFEVVSAFGTVGLSTGLTAKLSLAGKWLIAVLMFIGRLGPLVMLAAIQAFRRELYYTWPEEDILIG